MNKYVLKLNIKALIHFEKLTGRSFSDINYEDYNDLLKLIYCCYYCNNEDFTYKYEVFEKVVLNNKKISVEIFNQFNKIVTLQNQFSSLREVNSVTTEENSEGIYINKLIPILVTNCGLDINYILNEMPIDDIGLYISNYNNNRKEELQLQRLWSFYSILPHTGKKLKSPKELILFNWEIEEDINKSKAIADEFSDKLGDILKNAKI